MWVWVPGFTTLLNLVCFWTSACTLPAPFSLTWLSLPGSLVQLTPLLSAAPPLLLRGILPPLPPPALEAAVLVAARGRTGDVEDAAAATTAGALREGWEKTSCQGEKD